MIYQKSELGKHVAQNSSRFISKATAARALRVSPIVLDRLIQTHNIATFQIPGHSRKWVDRAAVEQLVADAAGLPGRAGAMNG